MSRQHQWQAQSYSTSSEVRFICSVCGADCTVSVGWVYSGHWREYIFQAFPPKLTYCPPGATPETCIEPERSA